MKKLILAACLAFLSITTFASTRTALTAKPVTASESTLSAYELMVAQVRLTATHTTPCGATWSCVAYGATEQEAVQGMLNLFILCDAACGTTVTTIIAS